MGRKIFEPEKYGMVICQAVTAKGIFKLQNDSVVQNAEALNSLKKKRRKM